MAKDVFLKLQGTPSLYKTWVDYSIRMKQSNVSVEDHELFYTIKELERPTLLQVCLLAWLIHLKELLNFLKNVAGHLAKAFKIILRRLSIWIMKMEKNNSR